MGVLTIRQPGALPVQVVNFDNPPAGELYAGGPKSELDILELLTRCPVDVERLRELASGYRMSEQLEQVLAKVGV